MTEDAKSAEDAAHGAERNRRALLTALSALAGRGFGMMLSLISLPLTVGYLDAERYGLWLTIGSALTWLTIADLGLGNGLANAITTARAKGDDAAARRAVSSAVVMLLGVALSMCVVFAALFPFVPWAKVFAASPRIDRHELDLTVALCLGIFALGFPTSVADRVLGACQEGYLVNYWSSASGALSTVGLVLAVRFASGLPTLVVVLSGLPLLVRFASIFWVFYRRHPELRPRWRDYDGKTARALVTTGGAFLVAQLAALAILQTDNMIIAQIHGSAAVGPYSIAFRIAGLISGIIGMFLGPLWPAYADAVARGDLEWIRATLRRTTKIWMLLSGGAAVGTVLFGQWVIRVWTRKPELVPSRRLLVPIAVYLVLLIWCQLHAIPLNGLGRVRGQAVYGTAAGIVNLVLSVVLGVAVGVDGVCWATNIAMLIPATLAPIELYRALRVPLKPAEAPSAALAS